MHRPAMLRWIALGAALAVSACAAGPQAGAPNRETLSDLVAAAPAADGLPDRFSGKLYLVLLDDQTHPSLRAGRSLWALTEDIAYTPSDGVDTICVPKGFVTDLASIPQLFWDLLPPDGPWVKAAVIHDYLYYTRGSGQWYGHPRSITRAKDYTKDESDWILRDAMQDRGVDAFRRNVIYFAVQFGGQGGWDNSPGKTTPTPEKAGDVCKPASDAPAKR